MFKFNTNILFKRKPFEAVKKYKEVVMNSKEQEPIFLKTVSKVEKKDKLTKGNPDCCWGCLFDLPNREKFLKQLANYIYSVYDSSKDVEEKTMGLQKVIVKINNEDKILWYYDFNSSNIYSLHIIKQLLKIEPQKLLDDKEYYVKKLYLDSQQVAKLMSEYRDRPLAKRWCCDASY